MIVPNELTTVNITLKVYNKDLIPLENALKNGYDLISFEHLTDTSAMYLEDKEFQKLVKQRKDLKNFTLDYIIKHNHKYK